MEQCHGLRLVFAELGRPLEHVIEEVLCCVILPDGCIRSGNSVGVLSRFANAGRKVSWRTWPFGSSYRNSPHVGEPARWRLFRFEVFGVSVLLP